jgi:hypothetical protein
MRELISATFTAAWESAHPDVPLIIENEALPSGDFQILLTIVPTTSQQATMARPGERRVRRNGYAQVKLWVPAGAATLVASTLGDEAQAILELKQLPSPVASDEPITFLPSSAGGAGAVTDGRWYMTLVRIPMYWFERK